LGAPSCTLCLDISQRIGWTTNWILPTRNGWSEFHHVFCLNQQELGFDSGDWWIFPIPDSKPPHVSAVAMNNHIYFSGVKFMIIGMGLDNEQTQRSTRVEGSSSWWWWWHRIWLKLETHNDWTIWIWLLIFPVDLAKEFPSPKMDPFHSTKISPRATGNCEAKLEVSEEMDLLDTFFAFQSFREPKWSP